MNTQGLNAQQDTLSGRLSQRRTGPRWGLGVALATALLAGAPPAAHAGAVDGAIRQSDAVNARTVDIYNIAFRGGEIAEIGVRGDGDSDLDLEVRDAAGRLVAYDIDGTDQCYVRFWVSRTGTYNVRIINNGRVYNAYLLVTN